MIMTNNFTDRIKLVLDPGGTKMQVHGTQEEENPLVLFETVREVCRRLVSHVLAFWCPRGLTQV